jgi:hypothetical protein
MKKNIKDLYHYIEVDQVRIISSIVKYYKEKREEEENKKLSNKERPNWNGNSLKVSSQNETYDKNELRDQRKATKIFDEIIEEVRTINSVEVLNEFNNEYEKFFDGLIKLKIDLIRSDLIFEKWNVSTDVLLAANKFKKKLSSKTTNS